MKLETTDFSDIAQNIQFAYRKVECVYLVCIFTSYLVNNNYLLSVNFKLEFSISFRLVREYDTCTALRQQFENNSC